MIAFLDEMQSHSAINKTFHRMEVSKWYCLFEDLFPSLSKDIQRKYGYKVYFTLWTAKVEGEKKDHSTGT